MLNIEEYLKYFEQDKQSGDVYINTSFIKRIKELGAKKISYLLQIAFSSDEDDEYEIMKIRDAFENGKTIPKKYNHYKKEKIPSDIRWSVWERDNFTCKRCGSRKYLHVDHILPESKGGTLELSNLQTLCKICNIKKGNRLP